MNTGSNPTPLSFREPTALAADLEKTRLRMMALTVGLPLLCLGLYFGLYLFNSVGLKEKKMSAVVTGKQFYEGNSTYTTKVVGSQSWVQSSENPGIHMIQLDAEGEKLVAVVQHADYLKYESGDTVTVLVRRYRLTGSYEVIDITSHRKQGV